MHPKNYQIDIINKSRQSISKLSKSILGRKPRIILRMPCGSGKTATAAFISKSVLDKGGSVIFLCHRDFLLDQTSKTFTAIGIDHSFLAAGKWLNPWKKCHIGMIGSMKSRMKRVKPPTICFIDECQSTPAKTWTDIVDAWPETIFIGLSATPSFRSDGKGLGEIYDEIIHGPTERDLINSGDLSEYKWYAPTSLDTSSFNSNSREYIQSESDEAMSKAAVIGDIVESYKKYANGTIAIYFATSVETSKAYAVAFNDAGIPASHIDADTPQDIRSSIAKKMASREILIMTNVMIASAGYDLAAQAGRPVTVETVGLCRPTKSLPLLIQMSMRAMRSKSYPGIILDHVNSYKEHNWLPDDDIEWTLSGSSRNIPTIGIMQCRGCGAALKRGSLSCGHCGSVNEPLSVRGEQVRSGLQHVDGELAIISREEAAIKKAEAIAERKSEQGQARTYEELVELAKRRGYKNPRGWAKHIYSARMSRG